MFKYHSGSSRRACRSGPASTASKPREEASNRILDFASPSSPAMKVVSVCPCALPLVIVWAKTVLNAFTTVLCGSFFCSSSAPLVENPQRQLAIRGQRVGDVDDDPGRQV